MARKINVKLILELRESGMSRSMISSSRGISRNSIREVFSIADEKQIAYSDVADKSDDEVYRLFYPQKYLNDASIRPQLSFVHCIAQKTG